MSSKKIAVIIPCLNEETTIGNVVKDFQKALPGAEIYVYDNDSTDHTAKEAIKAGAKLRFCDIPGKGAVLRAAFQEVNADVYVLADGDGTYPPDNIDQMLEALNQSPKSIVIGNRKADDRSAMKWSHIIGNKFLKKFFCLAYGFSNVDVLSGSRVINQEFAKSFPAVYDGFETETEMALYAWKCGYKIITVDIPYLKRTTGSESKIHTFRDGYRIIKLAITGRKAACKKEKL